MILSMTGYGTGSVQKDETTVTVEIRTVNHRFLDLQVRVSREYLFLEAEAQQIVRNFLDRGRVEVNVTVQKTAAAAFLVDTNLVKGYLESAGRLKDEFGLQDTLELKTLLTLPGVLQNRDAASAVDVDLLTELLKKSMSTALEDVLRMRRRKGEALRTDMLQNLASVEDRASSIRQLSANSAQEYMQKLQDRLALLLPQGGVDPQRLAQETALIADKVDISEEIARLQSHIEQYRALMDSKEKVGKKLDFLLQELQREANTILSKSMNVKISWHAITIKTDIEKIREQVQNVE